MRNISDNKISTVQVEYDSEKLEAIRFYLQDKNSTIKRELTDALDSVYKKNVPAQVREYIERKGVSPSESNGSEQQSEN